MADELQEAPSHLDSATRASSNMTTIKNIPSISEERKINIQNHFSFEIPLVALMSYKNKNLL